MSHITRFNSSKNESFCKLRSNYGLRNELYIHGLEWWERVVLKVNAFDRTNAKIVVENENGLTWVSDLKSMEFCNPDGSKIIDELVN